MPTTGNHTVDIVLYSLAGVLALFIGYRLGRFVGGMVAGRQLAAREQDLFTTQKGFKTLYEQELATLKAENASLKDQIQALNNRVEEYRKKAAGYGGLFNSGGKKADAMYALLMENEALEEALYSQNEKLRQERTDALKETLRSTGYRRVLMSQLLNDERIKQYVAEVIEDKQLPAPNNNDRHALPAGGESPER
jgi:cell division protein FtsB